MSFSSIRWKYNESDTPGTPGPVVIDTCKQINHTTLYAVRQLGCCLNSDGEWEREPIPSSRTDEFLARCRYETWEKAAGAIVDHCKPRGRFEPGTTVREL
jgi:hypothetical protein